LSSIIGLHDTALMPPCCWLERLSNPENTDWKTRSDFKICLRFKINFKDSLKNNILIIKRKTKKKLMSFKSESLLCDVQDDLRLWVYFDFPRKNFAIFSLFQWFLNFSFHRKPVQYWFFSKWDGDNWVIPTSQLILLFSERFKLQHLKDFLFLEAATSLQWRKLNSIHCRSQTICLRDFKNWIPRQEVTSRPCLPPR